jgi:tetratricopeptide (TPR) repeat protein
MNSHPEHMQLNLHGITEGTDKTFLANDYLSHYARIFAEYKDAPINVMEIGVATGGSLRTWQKYFPRATIIGVDIETRCLQYAGDRMIVELGSQADEAFLKGLSDKYQPTIIIDDGSHVSDHQIISLECLFPLMPAGGIYVIEDLFFQANPATAAAYGGGSPLALDYLAALAVDRAGWIVPDPAAAQRRSLVGRHLNRIEFFQGCAVLFKQDTHISQGKVIELAEAALKDSDNGDAWFNIFRYAIRFVGQASSAENAARRMLELSGDQAQYHSRLSQVRLLQGNRDAAIAEARHAVDMSAGASVKAHYQGHLERLLAARG